MKIYWYNGNKNIVGKTISKLRKEHTPKLTQADLSAKLELMNVQLDRLSISRIESGDRFVADYELLAMAKIFNVKVDDLFRDSEFCE